MTKDSEKLLEAYENSPVSGNKSNELKILENEIKSLEADVTSLKKSLIAKKKNQEVKWYKVQNAHFVMLSLIKTVNLKSM